MKSDCVNPTHLLIVNRIVGKVRSGSILVVGFDYFMCVFGWLAYLV